MGGLAEGLGSAIEGALTARAVEPERGGNGGEMPLQPPQDCPNCGARITSTFCADCGQKRDAHRTLAAIGHDLLHGVLHLDGKLWTTLPLLIFRPGQLTRRYIEGERAKFVSPMATFLFSVFVMFAVFQIVGLTVPSDFQGREPKGLAGALEMRINAVEANLASVEQQLADAELEAWKRAELEAERVWLLDAARRLARVRGLPAVEARLDSQAEVVTGIDVVDKGIIKKWRRDPELFLYKLQSNGYKFGWLLIPLSIPFVWLLFARHRQFKAYDHAVFVTYSLSFMSLLFIVGSLVSYFEALRSLGALTVAVLAPLHLYRHLRGTYGIGRFSAVWRLVVLFLFVWIVIALFLQTLLLLGGF